MAARGRHAGPGARGRWTVSTARARHGQLLPAPLTAALVGAVSVGLGLLAALPTSAAAPATTSPAARAAPASLVVPTVGRDDRIAPRAQELRASRDRRPVLPVAPSPLPSASPAAKPLLVLPGCSASGASGGFANGRLPSSVLCDLQDGSGERLRADAARSFWRLSAAYALGLGERVCIIDGYRPLGEQQQLRRTKPRYAARPGSSEHGWGLAVDLGCGVLSSRSRESAWMVANAGRYGWVHPEWARPGGSRPEPWHWEYVGRP